MDKLYTINRENCSLHCKLYANDPAPRRMVVYGLAVVLVMVFRPQGILGGIEFSPRGIYNRITGKGERKNRLAPYEEEGAQAEHAAHRDDAGKEKGGDA